MLWFGSFKEGAIQFCILAFISISTFNLPEQSKPCQHVRDIFPADFFFFFYSSEIWLLITHQGPEEFLLQFSITSDLDSDIREVHILSTEPSRCDFVVIDVTHFLLTTGLYLVKLADPFLPPTKISTVDIYL